MIIISIVDCQGSFNQFLSSVSYYDPHVRSPLQAASFIIERFVTLVNYFNTTQHGLKIYAAYYAYIVILWNHHLVSGLRRQGEFRKLFQRVNRLERMRRFPLIYKWLCLRRMINWRPLNRLEYQQSWQFNFQGITYFDGSAARYWCDECLTFRRTTNCWALKIACTHLWNLMVLLLGAAAMVSF